MRLFRFFSVILLILAAASSASGQIIIDGVETGTTEYTIGAGKSVGTADVSGSYWGDDGYYYIRSIRNDGTVNSATVNDGGGFNNWDGGTVNSAEVSGGWFDNSGGTVNSATVGDMGWFDNYSGTVNSATVNGGQFDNYDGGTVNSATVNSGLFANHSRGTVNSATVNSGTFANYDGGTVGELTLNGGTFNTSFYIHKGTVNSASLFGGSYEDSGYTGNLYVGEGGTLDTGLYTGLIGDLTFANNGSGLLVVSGTSFDAFKKVNIKGSVDLTGAAIQLGFDPTISSLAAAPLAFGALAFGAESLSLASSTFADFSFDLASLFNFIGDDSGFLYENWWEGIASVALVQAGEVFNLYSHGNGWFGLQEADGNGNETPEPATLLIIGLGLAGLGLARRKRSK